jgi:hypothetical protein
MANMFKRAALALGRFTGLKREPRIESIDLLETSQLPAESSASIDAGQSPLDLPSVDADQNPWNDALTVSDSMARQDTDAAIEAAIATGQFENLSTPELTPETVQPIEAPLIVAVSEPALETVSAASVDSTPLVEAPVEVTVSAETPATIEAVIETPAAAIEKTTPIIEIKPEPLKTPIAQPEPSVTFTQLYELISGEVNKRTDSAVTVYERLLSATREELEATRKSNRVAWSIGGVMTAVAALGAVWAAGEVSANRVEVGSLRQQVSVAQQVSLERDQLRTDLTRTREASARIEVDALKSRLDQALAVSADRDRLKDELQTLRQAKQETENELRLAKATATTQPVSMARPAAAIESAAGSERPDVWSMLLDGKDGR